MKFFEMPDAHQCYTASSMIIDACILLTPIIVALIGMVLWNELVPVPWGLTK
jgi:hypothetical protein